MFKEGDKVPTFSIITDKKEFILKEINTYKTVVFLHTTKFDWNWSYLEKEILSDLLSSE